MQVSHFGDPPETRSLPLALAQAAALPVAGRVSPPPRVETTVAVQLMAEFPVLPFAQVAPSLPTAAKRAPPPLVRTTVALQLTTGFLMLPFARMARQSLLEGRGLILPTVQTGAMLN